MKVFKLGNLFEKQNIIFARTLSPYAFAELNLKETASGLRGGKIPKPVYVQVRSQAR